MGIAGAQAIGFRGFGGGNGFGQSCVSAFDQLGFTAILDCYRAFDSVTEKLADRVGQWLFVARLQQLSERVALVDAFGKILAAAKRALEIYCSVGFEPKVLVTLTSQSLPDLEELICLLMEKKFTRTNLIGFDQSDAGANIES
jgi:hypothetical protein